MAAVQPDNPPSLPSEVPFACPLPSEILANMASKFELGPVLVGAEDIRGRTVPDPWRIALLRDYLDSPSRLALALTSKPAFQLLLQEWPAATLTIRVRPSAAEGRQAVQRRFHLAQEQLAMRGVQPTTLLIQQRGRFTKKEQWWHRVFAGLGAGGCARTLAPLPSPSALAPICISQPRSNMVRWA